MSSVTQLNIQYIDQDRPVAQEDGFAFNEELFNNCPDWTSLQGYFQTEKYFKHIEDEIKEDFTFEISFLCKHNMSEMDRPIALHIRRGDFLKNAGNHTNLGLDYYEKSLDVFDKDRSVIIFSDDL